MGRWTRLATSFVWVRQQLESQLLPFAVTGFGNGDHEYTSRRFPTAAAHRIIQGGEQSGRVPIPEAVPFAADAKTHGAQHSIDHGED